METQSVWSPWLFPGIWTGGPACLLFCPCLSAFLGMRQCKDVASLACFLVFVYLTRLIQRDSSFQGCLGPHDCPKQGPGGFQSERIATKTQLSRLANCISLHKMNTTLARMGMLSAYGYESCLWGLMAPRDASSASMGSWVEMGVVHSSPDGWMRLKKRVWG